MTGGSSHASESSTFNVTAHLRELDAIFEAQQGPTHAEPHLNAGLEAAHKLGDSGAVLTILNELTGFYRVTSAHPAAVATARRAMALAQELGLEGSDSYATTLINAATALRSDGEYEESLALYRQALATAQATMSPRDRRIAALHNNLSMLHSDQGEPALARTELEAALAILRAGSINPALDREVAASLTNLSLVLADLGDQDAAAKAVRDSMAIYERAGHLEDPHYASVLAGQGEACFRAGQFVDAERSYARALRLIETFFGRDNDYYAVTAENLAQAREAQGMVAGTGSRANANAAAPANSADASGAPIPTAEPVAVGQASSSRNVAAPTVATPVIPAPLNTTPAIKGLDLSRAYFEEFGRPLIEGKYAEYRGRIAAGLVGHGSDCYGFDDSASRDHDFGPGFCLWLTAEDYAEIGEQLQADYDALPAEFQGFPARVAMPRAVGERRRVGVFEIGAFYEQITGYREAPAVDAVHEWLMLEEATLAAATNGAVFVDPLGAFSGARGAFKRMPDDVRIALISRRLGMISQGGQYNVPRMLARGDGEAAWLSIAEFTGAVSSLIFLINRPTAVGYLPYYKWQFAALRTLRQRMLSRLPDVASQLSDVLRLASAACFGGAGFGEGGKGAAPAAEEVQHVIEEICAAILREITRMGWTSSSDPFLEHQRVHVSARINNEWLRSL